MGCDPSSGLGQAWVGTWMKMEPGFRTGTRVGHRTWLVTKCRVRSRALGTGVLGAGAVFLLKVLSVPGISLSWHRWWLGTQAISAYKEYCLRQ